MAGGNLRRHLALSKTLYHTSLAPFRFSFYVTSSTKISHNLGKAFCAWFTSLPSRLFNHSVLTFHINKANM